MIWWSFSYTGSQGDAEPYLAPFIDLGYIPGTSKDGNVPYPDIASAMQTGIEDPLCEPGLERITSTANLQVWNITTQRQIYELFKNKINEYPDLSTSWVVLEQYSVGAVRAVDPATSAYPFRDDNLLVYVLLLPTPTGFVSKRN